MGEQTDESEQEAAKGQLPPVQIGLLRSVPVPRDARDDTHDPLQKRPEDMCPSKAHLLPEVEGTQERDNQLPYGGRVEVKGSV
ncbi:hypothetical protein DFH11DRAFT_1732714 [Phellopilus nigrolimitatus]|nr:hypothetical protein DFH11DRAFT_1732714 [Phellopilus nigrolimitatus]